MVHKAFCFAAAALMVAAVVQPVPAANTLWQERPIQLGTSGGNINDSMSPYCCTGTLGALVEDGTAQYILSNNHVLARSGAASAGEAIIQPGLVDQGPVCYADTADTVAYLSDFVALNYLGQKGPPMNSVDAAIAEVVAGTVDPDGLILDIGQVDSQTAPPQVGQAVKKSGRTTGLTRGTVGSIKVTVDVGYTDYCGGDVTKVARFKNQILISSAGFSAGGDSGSLIVEDVESNPRAVGLLFAGASDGGFTIANRIDDVLSAFNVSLIGGQSQNGSGDGTGTIEGTVADAASGIPIADARVKTDTGQSTKTDANGFYIMVEVPAGGRTVEAAAKGYLSQDKAVEVVAGELRVADFALDERATGKPSKSTGLARAIEAKSRHEGRIMRIGGVVGVGVGLSEAGEAVVEVYLEADMPRARIPQAVDKVPVRVIVTGPFVAY